MKTPMKHSILFDPSFSMVEVELEKGEVLQAEAGAMVSRDSNVTMTTSMNAGKSVGFFQKVKNFFVAIVKKMLGGESFFINEFRSSNSSPAKVTIAPTLCGAVVHKKLENSSITLQGGAYLASCGNFHIKVKFAGLKALFSGHGLFFLDVSGTGDLFFNAFGGIMERDISGTFTLDTGHLVGFEKGLNYSIGKAGGLKSTLFSGEGLIMNFNGTGKLYMQSRNIGGLIDFINPRLPR